MVSLAWGEGEQGGRGLFDLSTAQKIEQVDEATALAIARTLMSSGTTSPASRPIKRLGERDEFTVAGYFNSGRPLLRSPPQRQRKTLLYISSKSGEVRQRHDVGVFCVLSWLGFIPHWLLLH